MTAPRHPDAREVIASVVDAGSFVSWDEPPLEPREIDASYAAALAAARLKTGVDESLITGEGTISGRRIAVVASEFGFLGGSIGVAAADRLARAVEKATRLELPLVAAPASGGTRMQEGTIAFLQMVKITAAITRHKAAGLPYLVYLRHPTMGGVLASWGSLGHVTAAEPGALIGFLGPRVYQTLYGEPFPSGVQRAENLLEHGLIDAVIALEDVAGLAARTLSVLAGSRERPPDIEPLPLETLPDLPAVASIERSRRPDRPGVRRLLRVAATDVSLLRGTGAGETEPGLVLALARFNGVPCIVVGQDRRRDADRPLGPGGLR
ncbi:MAG: acetyl-CoA carboxylase carboxyltransferase subunit alpha/beta, partial [Candidatus Dormibacteraeota bacterium]|nr:acetyl-CoA carboxylase carboxyltransferase subunit alpha/beta [Candidatus Dormibacteraeota bacterium]